MVKGTMDAVGPIVVPTINRVKGSKAIKRIIKGIERVILIILSKTLCNFGLGKIPAGSKQLKSHLMVNQNV